MPQHRSDGPWAMKKALHSIFCRLPGYHIDYATIKEKETIARTETSTWEVSDDELDAGVDDIHRECPEDNDESQQWVWIQKKIKKNSKTPIAGWPEHKVARVAENKAKGSLAAAKVERKFPLLVFDLHPVWSLLLLPIILPLFLEYGILLLGQSGVGKTPLFYIIAFMIGRFHERKQDGSGRAGVRKGRMFLVLHRRLGIFCYQFSAGDTQIRGG